MRLFHRTTDADEILRNGFCDGPRYLVDRVISGVWLSYRPLDIRDGADAREYSGVWLSDEPLAVSDETPAHDLVVEVPEEDIKPFEWTADAEGCRGFFVPAEVLNRYPVRLPMDEERSVSAHEEVGPAEMTDAHERLQLRSPPAGREPAWRTVPWTLLFFGNRVTPLGLLSIIPVILQPVAERAPVGRVNSNCATQTGPVCG